MGYAKALSIALNLLPLIIEAIEIFTKKGQSRPQAIDLAVSAVRGALEAITKQVDGQ